MVKSLQQKMKIIFTTIVGDADCENIFWPMLLQIIKKLIYRALLIVVE